jgi:hypothetical protein
MPPCTLPAKLDMSGVIRIVIDSRCRSASTVSGAPGDVRSADSVIGPSSYGTVGSAEAAGMVPAPSTRRDQETSNSTVPQPSNVPDQRPVWFMGTACRQLPGRITWPGANSTS